MNSTFTHPSDSTRCVDHSRGEDCASHEDTNSPATASTQTSSVVKRQRLVIVTTVSTTVETILRDQPRRLSDEFDVTVVTSSAEGCRRIAAREGIRVQQIDMQRRIHPLADLVSLFRMFLFLRRSKPDIVQSYTPKAGLLTMMAAWAARVPVRIHTFTGLVFPTSAGVKRFIVKTCDRFTCLCATTIVPEGNGVKQDLRRFHITSKPLNVIGSGNIAGVDLNEFSPDLPELQDDARQLRNTLSIAPGEFLFCFIGRLNRDKGISELAQAWREARPKNSRLVFVGDEDVTNPVADDVLTSLRNDPTVHFAGFQTDVRPWLALTDALVLPSYREGFPNVLLQAAAMRVPSIVTNINGCNEAVLDGETGWIVAPRDASNLAGALATARTSSTSTLQQMGATARDRMQQHFERSAHWNRLTRFYRRRTQQASADRGTFWKHCLDRLVALMLIVALAPILLAISALVMLFQGRPVLFSQNRPGRHGKPFRMVKFRTMRNAVDADGKPLPDEKRLTKFGTWLRSTSLDELPELWNVLKGDMSLVGPRPLLMDYLPLYSERQARRHDVRPGVTGWAQVNGRNAISWEEKFELDVWYVENRSLALDTKILLLTVRQVLKRDGVSAEDHVTMPVFRGQSETATTEA